MEKSVDKSISGWGRYPVVRSRVYRPERLRALRAVLAGAPETTLIARGLGRSYGDPAVNDGGAVVEMTRLDRVRSFDEARGVLHCEGGMSLAAILDCFLPRGWFLPVTPGTRYVTVGGAIANDVHGKNHHVDGSFGQHVEEIELLTAEGQTIFCSPERESEIFWATVGGVGLTGVIVTAKLRLQRVESGWIRTDTTQAVNLEGALAGLAAADKGYQYSVAWIDCLARGAKMGRSVLLCGSHAGSRELGGRATFPARRGPRVTVPIDFPSFAMNHYTIAGFNEVYYRTHPTRQGLLTEIDPFFYPLDAVGDWSRMYGRHGFVQYQATFPTGELKGLETLLERLGRASRASFLAVLKIMGEGSPGWLSYPSPGFTLALDIPVKPGLREFLAEQDRLVLDHGGRLYLAKDAVTTADAIAAMYPRLGEFRELCARLDPRGRLSSTMARRLRLRGEAVR